MATQPHAAEPRADAEHPVVPSTAMQAAIAIEPDLRLIEGIVSVLIHLGERTDPIEAGAVAALARSAHEPVLRLVELRRAIARRRDENA